MGGFFSRYYHFHETSESCGRVDTPKVTPRRKIVIDPRSPSSDISRTPIQVEVTPRHRDAEKKISPLAIAAPASESFVSGAVETRVSTTSMKHLRVSVLQRERDPRSPSYGIARTPLQVTTDGEESDQPVEQVQEILMYEGRTEVPLVKNSPGETTHPSCARIMGLPPQVNLTSRTTGTNEVGAQAAEAGRQQQLDADMSVFLSGLSKALSLTEGQQQKVMRTYHGRENSLNTKKLQQFKQKGIVDDTPVRVRVPLSNVNSPHQMWRGRSGKEDRHRLSAYSENTPPNTLHDASKLHAVWDQDATVII